MRQLALLCLTSTLIVGCKAKEPEVEATATASLSITEPVLGAHVAVGQAAASGHVTGIEQVTVNDLPATMNGAQWSTTVEVPRGITTLEIAGVDATGHRIFDRRAVLAGEFAEAKGPVADAMGLRLNKGGLEATGAAVADLLDVNTLNEGLTAVNPVYEDAYGLLGFNAVEFSADIGYIDFDPMEMGFELTPGTMDLSIALPAFEVYIPVVGQILGIDFDTEAWMGANAQVDTQVKIGTDGEGHLTVELLNPVVTLDNFWYDTTLLPGDIETILFVDTIRGAIESTLVEQLNVLVPPMLEAQLAALPLTFDVELMQTTVSMGLLFESAMIDTEGVMLVADIDVAIPEGSSGRTAPGYLVAPKSNPTPDRTSDVSMALSDDLINRVAYEAWLGGMLDMSLSTANGDLDLFMFAPLGATSEATLIIEMGLPPVLIEEDGVAALQIGEVGVTIETPGGTEGDTISLSVGGTIPLDLEVKSGELVMALGTPELDIMVRGSDWGASNETLTTLLENEIPLDTMMLLFSNFTFPLPAIGDFAIGDAAIDRDASGVFTSVSMEL